MCRRLAFVSFFMLMLGVTEAQSSNFQWIRAAYWDGRYPTSWAGEGQDMRDALQAAGYEILNADQLKTWMNARITGQAPSVLVFCRDIVPETVAESMSANSTIRRYLSAGGKIVWYADIPFYYVGHANGSRDTWGVAGATAILGVNAAAVWDSNTPVTITATGTSWGLTEAWTSVRAASAKDVFALATDAGGNAAAWVKHYVAKDVYRGFVRLRDAGGTPPAADVIRAAEYTGLEASNPEPANGDTDVTSPLLQWSAGRSAVSHAVYIGPASNLGPPNLVSARQPFNLYFHVPGLEAGVTYYWRVDEIEADGTIRPGQVWSFTTPDSVVVDDFENYSDDIDAGEAIFQTWQDGFSNGTGSHAGYSTAPFAERTVVHEGEQSMPLVYDNASPPFFSEVSRTFATPFDMKTSGAQSLALYLKGQPGNARTRLYSALEDTAGKVALVAHPDPGILTSARWIEWNIPLNQFTGVNLSAVRTITLGVGDHVKPTPGGGGTLFVDDIYLALAPVTRLRAGDIATGFAGLRSVESITSCWDGNVNHRFYEVRGHDDRGPLAIGVDPGTGVVAKFVKQCPYPGRDSEIAVISGPEAVNRCSEFLGKNQLPAIPTDALMENTRLDTTWTMRHWRVCYRHYAGGVQVLPDFVLFQVNAENGEIASYSRVWHEVTVGTKPSRTKEEAISLARGALSNLPSKTYSLDLPVLSSTLTILYPNHYFPDLIYRFSQHQALAWVVQFGQDQRPALDVWIDAVTGALLGGEIYERPVPELYGIPDQQTDISQIWEPALDAMQYNTIHTFLGNTTVPPVVNSIQSAEYFILQTHGSPNSCALGGGNHLTPGDIPTNNLRYALLSCCESGVTTPGNDLWEAFINRGADVFHGYPESTNPDYYEQALTRYLALGDSLWNAHSNALADSGYSHPVTIKYGPPLYCFNQLRLAPLSVRATGSVHHKTVTLTATIRNLEDARQSAATNVTARLVVPWGFSVSGANPKTVSSLAWNNTWTIQWTASASWWTFGPRTFDVIVTTGNLGVAVSDFTQATASAPRFHPVKVTVWF